MNIKFVTHKILLGPKTAGAPSPEHQRLKARLVEWYAGRGVTPLGTSIGEYIPDFLRDDPSQNTLYIGDAKHSANESTSTTSTTDRILGGYFYEFAERVRQGAVTIAGFAIATNDRMAAQEWANALTSAASAHRLARSDDSVLEAQVAQLDAQTWVSFF